MPAPFGDAVDRIPLPRAPLARVVAQVRFPRIASVVRDEFIAPFQELIRQRYGIARKEQQQQVVVSNEGIAQAGGDVVWRFTDQAHPFALTMATSFIALDCRSYTNREEFFEHLRLALDALAEVVAPRTFDRIGVRYIDRIDDPEVVGNITSYVVPEVAGVAGVELGGNAEMILGVTETLFAIGEQRLKCRWGQLPPQTTFDPSIDPVDAPTWILDLDAYVEGPSEFDASAVADDGEDLARVIYRFFRWAVKDEFLLFYGGDA